MSDYTKSGGKWLGAARSWVQRNCYNGSQVTWGSNDILNPPLSIGQVEELAATVADAANREADAMELKLTEMRKRRLELELRVDWLEKEVKRLTR